MTLNTIAEASQHASKPGSHNNQQNVGHQANGQINTGSQSFSTKSTHLSADHALWWLDFFTTKGRKAENQDSLLITTCLPYHFLDATLTGSNHSNQAKHTAMPPAPLLVLMADGVSACQFPKQASQLVINIVADKLTLALSKLAQTTHQSHSQTTVMSFDDTVSTALPAISCGS